MASALNSKQSAQSRFVNILLHCATNKPAAAVLISYLQMLPNTPREVRKVKHQPSALFRLQQSCELPLGCAARLVAVGVWHTRKQSHVPHRPEAGCVPF